MDSATQTFLIISSALTLWLFILWMGACGALKLVSLYFPGIDDWRGALMRLLAWGWLVPLCTTLVAAYIGLLGA